MALSLASLVNKTMANKKKLTEDQIVGAFGRPLHDLGKKDFCFAKFLPCALKMK